MTPLSEDELSSFQRYAKANDTEPNGDQSQWADYTLRLIAEVREARKREKQEAEAFHLLTCPNCGCVCEITIRNDNRDGPGDGPIVPVFACNACTFEWRNFLSEDIGRTGQTPPDSGLDLEAIETSLNVFPSRDDLEMHVQVLRNEVRRLRSICEVDGLDPDMPIFPGLNLRLIRAESELAALRAENEQLQVRITGLLQDREGLEKQVEGSK